MRQVTIFTETTRQNVLNLVSRLNKSNEITLRELTEHIDNDIQNCSWLKVPAEGFLIGCTGMTGDAVFESKSMGGGCNFIGFSTMTVYGESGTTPVCDFIGNFTSIENPDVNLLVLTETDGITGKVMGLYNAYSNKDPLFTDGGVDTEEVREMIKRQIARSFNRINSIDKFLTYIGFTKH